ncbi:uncharacterized protein LOC113335136, partial [Papaver somniferum]
NKLLLTQNKYSVDLLRKHDMLGCKPRKTPVTSGPRISSYDVNYVSQFMRCPTDIHFQLAKHILIYIKGYLGQGITLGGGNYSELIAYCDSDMDGCLDTRKSTLGYCVFVGGNLVSWSAKKQHTISRSSTEAEYKSLANAAAEILWLSYLFDELFVKLSLPCKLFCDNFGA